MKTKILMLDLELLTKLNDVKHWPNEWFVLARCLWFNHLQNGFILCHCLMLLRYERSA